MSERPLRVALRADASAQIGIGHVKRSLALGQALRECGADVRIVTRTLGVDTATPAAAAAIERVALPTPADVDWKLYDDEPPHAGWAQVGWRDDAEDTAAALAAWAPDAVVVDHYAFDARWHRHVAAALRVAVIAIDDVPDRTMAIDCLVDHSHAADHRAKYAGRLEPRTRVLGGPRFALLGPGYATAPRHSPSPEVRSIGIFMGGIDAAGASALALEACRRVATFDGLIEIVATSDNPHLRSLQNACSRTPETRLVVDLPNLAAFFARHDLQIGAGGGATWERCCIGAPTIAVVCAENQRAGITALLELGVVATPAGEDLSVPAIGRSVARLLGDSERRVAMAQQSRALVDGLGARRVALSLAASRLALRRATLADAERMHVWRDHPATRAMSHDAKPIAWSAHREWLAHKLADASCLLLIGRIGDIDVGVIRFDRLDAARERVSLYLDPALHGLGLGAALLGAGERAVRERGGGTVAFEATVLEANAASQRMFRTAGYRQQGERWIKPATVRPARTESTC